MLELKSNCDQEKKRGNIELTGTWSPISLILSMSSFTLWGSFALVRMRGLRILSRGSSRTTGPGCWGTLGGDPELQKSPAHKIYNSNENAFGLSCNKSIISFIYHKTNQLTIALISFFSPMWSTKCKQNWTQWRSLHN